VAVSVDGRVEGVVHQLGHVMVASTSNLSFLKIEATDAGPDLMSSAW
jgi:hypothetical protein